MHKDGSTFPVDACVNNTVQGRFVLDTGATLTVIDPNPTRQLGIWRRNERTITLHTAGGQIQAPVSKGRSFRVGTAGIRNLDVVIHDLRYPMEMRGVIGLNFLNHFVVSLNSQ